MPWSTSIKLNSKQSPAEILRSRLRTDRTYSRALADFGARVKLGLVARNYQTINRPWLRWMAASGNLILLPSEEAAAKQRVERLEVQLRQLGIDLNRLD